MSNDNYNRGGYIAFLFSMTFSLAFCIYVTVVHPGVDLKEVQEQPEGGAEQTLAAVDVSKVENPWMPSDDLIAHGKKIYANNCTVCHGENGGGDGPGGKGLNPPPRNFIEGDKWTKGADRVAIYQTLTEGISGTAMAAFAHLNPVDRWALVHLVRSWAKEPVKDDDAKVEAFAKTAK